MIDFSIPLAGLNAAEGNLNRTAADIARSRNQATTGGDTVDLSTEMVALIEAKNNFAANLKSIQTEDQMTQSLLKVVG